MILSITLVSSNMVILKITNIIMIDTMIVIMIVIMIIITMIIINAKIIVISPGLAAQYFSAQWVFPAPGKPGRES